MRGGRQADERGYVSAEEGFCFTRMTAGRSGGNASPGMGPIMMTRIALAVIAVIMLGCIFGAAIWKVRYRKVLQLFVLKIEAMMLL